MISHKMSKKLLSSDYYSKKLENGVEYINIHTCPILYKYQSASEYSLHNFEADEVWGTVPTAFNDPYDCAVCFTVSKLHNAIRRNLTEQRLRNYRSLFNASSKKEVTEQIVNSILENNDIRKQYAVACFSIYNDSEIMWGHYADSAKGFCLAYDGRRLMETAYATTQSTFDLLKEFNIFGIDFSDVSADNLSSIMPVIYRDGKINITDHLLDTIPDMLNCYDNLCKGMMLKEAYEDLFLRIKQKYYNELEKNNDLFYSMMCRKSKVWNYEQEWRIWTYNSNVFSGNFENPYMKIGNAKATAVYLGEKMPENMRRVVIEIAKMKHIPVYQMKSIMYAHCYKLKPILIQSN